MKNKWIPLVAYNDSGKDTLVLAKRNSRTGMIRFRTKSMTRLNTISHFSSDLRIDIPGATMLDSLSLVRHAFWHLEYGFTMIYKDALVPPSQWSLANRDAEVKYNNLSYLLNNDKNKF